MVSVKCKNCNSSFMTHQWKIRQGKGKFCSKKCLYEWAKNNLFGNKSGGWRGGDIVTKCLHCGKTISDRKSSNRKFCNSKCSSEWRKENFKGNNNPCWRGGSTTRNQTIRGSIKYSAWKLEVFERDKFTCQVCKKVGGDINAHHITSYAEIVEFMLKNGYTTMKIVESNNKLWDISNGLTLCRECHLEVHRIKKELNKGKK